MDTVEINKTVKRLKNVPVLMFLSDEVLTQLAEHVEEREFAKDEVVFRRGDNADSLLLIRSGWAKTILDDAPGGAEVVLNHSGPGETIGDLSLIDGQPQSATIIAVVGMRALELKRAPFMELLNANPALALEVMKGLTVKVRVSTDYVEKAIEWSNRIAKGDYHSALEQVGTEHKTLMTRGRPDEAKMGEFLGAFYSMVEGVKKREDDLQNRIHELTIKVDETKVDKEVDELSNTSFFRNVKSAADKLRKQRQEK